MPEFTQESQHKGMYAPLNAPFPIVPPLPAKVTLFTVFFKCPFQMKEEGLEECLMWSLADEAFISGHKAAGSFLAESQALESKVTVLTHPFDRS